MSPLERRLVISVNGLVGIVGSIYAAMVYLMRPAEPWAVGNHPWQPHLQHLHVLTAPLLVFAVGLIWSSHVGRRWSTRGCERRHSGILLALLFPAMAASGYLFQISVADGWRRSWATVHLLTSLVWMAGFAVHLVAARRTPRPANGVRDNERAAADTPQPTERGRSRTAGAVRSVSEGRGG